MSYRKDDGRYARMFAFWAIFLLLGYGYFHGGGLTDLLSFYLGDANTVLVEPFPLLKKLDIAATISVALWAVSGLLLRAVLNGRRIADALIDTESEMQKVTWPTWNETWQGTLAVALMVVVLLIVLFAYDAGLVSVMQILLGSSGGGA